MMRKMMSSLLVGTLLMTGVGFAYEGGLPPEERTQTKQERPLEKPGEALAERLLPIVALYLPGSYEKVENLVAEHQNVHEALRNLAREKAAEKAISRSDFWKEMAEEVASGQLTRQEAKEKALSFHQSLTEKREAIATQRQAPDRERAKEQHETLKSALESEDEAAIMKALGELIKILEDHLLLDLQRLESFE